MTSKTTEAYKVEVCNHQKIGTETEHIREIGKGSLRCGNDKYYIMYKTGRETVMIKLFGDKANVKRVGESNLDMEFVKNKRTEVMYDTPYGTVVMEILLYNIEYSLDNTGGNVLISYDLFAGGDKIHNKMEIKIDKI